MLVLHSFLNLVLQFLDKYWLVQLLADKRLTLHQRIVKSSAEFLYFPIGCPENESYSCGNPFCEPTCANNQKACTTHIFQCVNQCYCNSGFVRLNTNGKCILQGLCPRVQKS